MKLLSELCKIHAPSGEEYMLTEYILNYIQIEEQNWKVKPKVYFGNDFQDSIVLSFGKPKTAIFAHMDSIGFTVGYQNELIKIGGPVTKNKIILVGNDKKGLIEGKIINKNNKLFLDFHREVDRGTSLSFKVDFRETSTHVQTSYLDNRLGVWNALNVAKTLENGIIVFSCWEEHGGGSVGYLAKFIYEKFNIRQALISDITWITDGIFDGKGVVISLRDSGIPRKKYVNKIIDIAEKNNIKFQLEVERSGGSDGNEIQKSPYPIDWCFIGAAEQNVHSPDEKVNKKDIKEMVKLYKILMKELN